MRCSNCGLCAPQWNHFLRKLECGSCHDSRWVEPGSDLWSEVYPDRPTVPLWVVLVVIAALFSVLVAGGMFSPVRAAEGPPCKPIGDMMQHLDEKGVKRTDLTQDQLEFIRGIYAMNPLTPPGLPFGDKAALMQEVGDEGGVIFFLDGASYCTPMPVPAKLIKMLADVAAGKISHEGSPL